MGPSPKGSKEVSSGIAVAVFLQAHVTKLAASKHRRSNTSSSSEWKYCVPDSIDGEVSSLNFSNILSTTFITQFIFAIHPFAFTTTETSSAASDQQIHRTEITTTLTTYVRSTCDL